MPTKYYYDGDEAKNIRGFTRTKVLETLEEILTEAGIAVGDQPGRVPVCKSSTRAADRLQRQQGFVLFLMRPTIEERHQVLGHDDGKAHSGRRYTWTFLIQVSRGKVGGETTNETRITADDDLMDTINDGFNNRYAQFRDELFFRDMTIAPSDDPREAGGMLNPLVLRFTNLTRLEADEFITIPEP